MTYIAPLLMIKRNIYCKKCLCRIQAVLHESLMFIKEVSTKINLFKKIDIHLKSMIYT